VVVALMTFNVFWRLSTTAISNSDEARYGVANGLDRVTMYRPATKCERFEVGIWQAKDANGKAHRTQQLKAPTG
jgi:hypothetical protein